ncbi:MAG: Unknown protein [uncultured Sulfurovum sp.]|uniref:Uncharacterized protein n=1 Tax=uncultured Sulfurovum sp. TaxID=269237 RepID=A0A6S6SBF6_9BACT|nr:MAG: Unknown protein [uncultured Sulfurovum sp.]
MDFIDVLEGSRPMFKGKINHFTSEDYFLWGMSLFILTLAFSLTAYYLYSPVLRYIAFGVMVMSVGVLFVAMAKDMRTSIEYPWVIFLFLMLLIAVYFSQRMEFHRFDFMVGDASDYFAAGVCSVTYYQDIGYILPLSATITAIGYEVFGIEYVLLSYVILYLTSVPIFYYIYRKLDLSVFLSLLLSLFLVFIPLSIWYAKSSFTEPMWQVLVFVFMVYAYRMMQQKQLEWKSIITLYALLFLAPMLRVEGVLFYGFILFLSLYHLWKFKNLKASMFMSFGLFIIAVSVQISLKLRPDYLLNRQFNRVIPNASEESVMFALYSLAIGFTLLVLLVYLFRKWFNKVNFPIVVTLLTFLVKVGVAYIYAIKKEMTFVDMLAMNEYGLTVGNFGTPIALLMIFGLVLLYRESFKGKTIALLLVVVYTVFYLPHVMQAVRFDDPHAFLFYWNRYYFAIFMIVHLFAFGLALKFIYNTLQKFVTHIVYHKALFLVLFLGIIVSSMNLKMYNVVVNESHLKGTHKLYSWVQERVGQNAISLVTESGVIYKQNARPDGLEKIEYLIGRTFSIYKMPILGHQMIHKKNLYPVHRYKLEERRGNYVLCATRNECFLDNDMLVEVDKFVMPLEWREHFGYTQKDAWVHQNDLSKSNVQRKNLYIKLYKVEKKLDLKKGVSFLRKSKVASNILGEGWHGIVNGNGALSVGSKAQLHLRNMRRHTGKSYTLMMQYIIMNASNKKPRTLRFSLNGEKISDVVVDSQFNDYSIQIPNKLLSSQKSEVLLEIERVDSSGKKLGVILESLRVIEK